MNMMGGLALAGGGLGLWKGVADLQRRQKQAQLQNETARWSQFTGMNPAAVDVPKGDIIGTAAQGAMGGAMLGGNIDSAKKAEALADSEIAANTAYANKYAPSAAAQDASAAASVRASGAPGGAPKVYKPQAMADNYTGGMWDRIRQRRASMGLED
jgi:hypothetical protein